MVAGRWTLDAGREPRASVLPTSLERTAATPKESSSPSHALRSFRPARLPACCTCTALSPCQLSAAPPPGLRKAFSKRPSRTLIAASSTSPPQRRSDRPTASPKISRALNRRRLSHHPPSTCTARDHQLRTREKGSVGIALQAPHYNPSMLCKMSRNTNKTCLIEPMQNAPNTNILRLHMTLTPAGSWSKSPHRSSPPQSCA